MGATSPPPSTAKLKLAVISNNVTDLSVVCLCLKPLSVSCRPSIFTEMSQFFDKETGVLEAPMIITVMDQVCRGCPGV